MPKKIDFRFILISDRKLCKSVTLPEAASRVFAAGAKAFQLREKELPSSEQLSIAEKINKSALKYNSRLIINDRLDIAMLVKASGIHSPENGFQAKDVKKFSENMLIGKSAHSVKSSADAEKNGFDYVIAGPVFRTSSKVRYGKPLGLKTLKEICSSVKIPVFAVGGINPYRAKKCIEAGAYGVAVISAVFKSKNIENSVRAFQSSIGGL